MNPPRQRPSPAHGRHQTGHALKGALLSLLGVAGAASAVWVWQMSASTDTTLDLPEEWIESAPGTEEPVGKEATERIPTEGPQVAVDPPVDDGLRTLYSEEVVEPQDTGRRLVLQVWNGKKGVPAPETEVFFLQGTRGLQINDPFGQHWSDLATVRGQRFKTDRQGRVELPSVRRWAIVTAQDQRSYGFGMFRLRHKDVESITMHPDETLTVSVVDPKGEPVKGVPVGVLQEIPQSKKPPSQKQLQRQTRPLQQDSARLGRSARNPANRAHAPPDLPMVRQRQAQLQSYMRDLDAQAKARARQKRSKVPPPPKAPPTLADFTIRKNLRARRRTDAKGLAVFKHFQVYRVQPGKWWLPQHADRFEAALMIPLQQPVQQPFQGRPVSTETLELLLPPTGSLALRPVDLLGNLFVQPVRVTLRPEKGRNMPWTELRARKAQNESLIEFPFVGLDLRFKAWCRLDDGDFSWSVPVIAGPNKPGEKMIVDLVVSPKAGMLFGRMLDSRGKPMSGEKLRFLINSGAGRVEGEQITLDPEGRFHLPYLVRDPHKAPFRLEVRREKTRPVGGLTKTLPTLAVGSVTNMGDLRIRDLKKIAYGHVLDDRGQPIKGARVKLQRERMTGGKKPRPRYVDQTYVATNTNDKGEYELFADLEAGTYRLRAQARDHFPLDTQGLLRGVPCDLRLVRKSRIVGTVLTPAWLKSRDLQVHLLSSTPGVKPRKDRVRDHKGKKYVYFDWVRAGSYNLEIRIQQLPDPLLTIQGLMVQPGQQGIHPRLSNLDLRPCIHRFEITAVDDKGKAMRPKAPLLARIVRPNGKNGFTGHAWRGNRVEILSTSPQLDVIPMSQGYRAERAFLYPGKSRLVFARIPPVRLRLPGLPKLVGKTPTWIAMVLVGDTGMPPKLETWDKQSNKISRWYGYVAKNGGAQLGKSETVTIPLIRDGRYRVIVHLGTKKEIQTVKIPIKTVKVQLVPGGGPQRITVKVDPKRIQAGLAEVERRRAAAAAAKAAKAAKKPKKKKGK